MSNLITPMLTSVEGSPTLDFYPTAIRFNNSQCAIINTSNDQICLNDTSEWNDIEHLVSRSTLFKTSTPTKLRSSYNRQNFSNSFSVSDDNSRTQNSNKIINTRLQNTENHFLYSNSHVQGEQIINDLWNVSDIENKGSPKACVNVNMGYNEGSSLESVVNPINGKLLLDAQVSDDGAQYSLNPLKSPQITEVITNPTRQQSVQATFKERYDDKTFKSGSKTGHSRLWGSCGSASTLHFNFDDVALKSKLLLEVKPLNTVISSPSTVMESQLTATNTIASTTNASTTSTTVTNAGLRNTPLNGSNRQNRFSQLSFEAEFDSDGRTHEQITVELTQFSPYALAEQITSIEFSYFRAIKSEEFLSFKWTGLLKHTHAPGIVASTRWFNQLNFWAQKVILECTELGRRTEMLGYLIRIIKKLVDSFNNLSSGMALMSALQVECIHRLKQTWNSLQNKDRATFRRMEELFSSDNNYEKLREHINSLKLPCIPYIGLYLTDLTYINIAHSKLSEFESQTKTDQINNILRAVSEFQQSKYDILHCTLLQRYLDSQRYIEELQKIIEENNYRMSLGLEPNPAEVVGQLTRQQQDMSFTPQRSPPSYACQHDPTSAPPLQCPISPKPLSPRSPAGSTKALTESPGDRQMMLYSPNDLNICDFSLDESEGGLARQDSTSLRLIGSPHFDMGKEMGYEDSLMSSSRYSDDDSVRVSLLCGAGRKSQFQKRTSIRFKRDSSSSSRQQPSSKTATLSSTSQSVVSEKELVGPPSKSLLDDSFIDATISDTFSNPTLTDEHEEPCIEMVVVSNIPKPPEVLSTPPICRCIIKKTEVTLIPKSSSKHNTEYVHLLNIARAAELATKFSFRGTGVTPADSDERMVMKNLEESLDEREVVRLIYQGVLSRKACLKNAKKSRFSTWARHWTVLMMSKTNAYFVFFENCTFRALERKDFKSKDCHVQDLKKVVVTRVRPSINLNISEQKSSLPNDPSSDGDRNLHSNLKKFFLVDKEYGTVYKFRDPTARSRGTPQRERRPCAGSVAIVPDTAAVDKAPPRTCDPPSLYKWYRALKRAIRTVNEPWTDPRDLIELSDS